MRRLLAIVGAALLSAAASAEPSGSARAANATAEGVRDFGAGRYREALEKFEASYTIEQQSSTLLYIARCQKQLGLLKEARSTLFSFLRLDPTNPATADAFDLLTAVEKAIREQIPPPPPAPPHPVAAATSATPAPQAPRPVEQPVKPPAPAAAVTVAPAAPVQSPWLQRGRWIASGAAVAVLGAAAFSGLQARSTSSELTGSQHTRAEVNTLERQLSSQASRTNLLLAAGGILAAGAGALWAISF